MEHFIERLYNVDYDHVDNIPYAYIAAFTQQELESENTDFKLGALHFWNIFSAFEYEKMKKDIEFNQYKEDVIAKFGVNHDSTLNYPYRREYFHNFTSQFASVVINSILQTLLIVDPDETSAEDCEDEGSIQNLAAQFLSNIMAFAPLEAGEQISGFIDANKMSTDWPVCTAVSLALNSLCSFEMTVQAKEVLNANFETLVNYIKSDIPRLTCTALQSLAKACSKFNFIKDQEMMNVLFQDVAGYVFDKEPKICVDFLNVISTYLDYCYENSREPLNQDDIVGFTQSCIDRNDTIIFHACYNVFINLVRALDIKTPGLVENIQGLVRYSFNIFGTTLSLFCDDLNSRYGMQEDILDFLYQAFLKLKLNLKDIANDISGTLFNLLNSSEWNQFSTPNVSKAMSIAIKYSSKDVPVEFSEQIYLIINKMITEGGPADIGNATLLLGNLFCRGQSMHQKLQEILCNLLGMLQNATISDQYAPHIALGINEILGDYLEHIKRINQSKSNKRGISTTTDPEEEIEQSDFETTEEFNREVIGLFFQIYMILSQFNFSNETEDQIFSSNQVFQILFQGFNYLVELMPGCEDFRSLWNSNKKIFLRTAESFIRFGKGSLDAYNTYILFIDKCVRKLPKNTNIFLNRSKFRIILILAMSQGSTTLAKQANAALTELKNK